MSLSLQQQFAPPFTIEAYGQQQLSSNNQHSLGLPPPLLLIAPCPEFPEVLRAKTGGHDNYGNRRGNCCGTGFGCCFDCGRFDCNLCCC